MCCGLYYDQCFGQGINAKEVRFMVIINNGVLVALSRIHVTKLFVVYLQGGHNKYLLQVGRGLSSKQQISSSSPDFCKKNSTSSFVEVHAEAPSSVVIQHRYGGAAMRR